MARIPIIPVGDVLIAAVQEDLRDQDALDLQSDLAMSLERTGAAGILIDLTVVETVDSFLGRLLNDVAQCMRLLGAYTVVVGLQPAVAITLVELGLELKGIRTALNPRQGIALLRTLIDRPHSAGMRDGR
jgi:rsbT antagonist protein RsbS